MAAITPERKAAMRAAWSGSDKTDVIALMLGTSRGRLCNIAKVEGWPPRRKIQQKRWQGEMLTRLEVYWTEGVPRREIAEQLGTSESRIFQLARENGWPARRPGRRRAVPA